MGIFNFFKRNNPNPKAQNSPREVVDFGHASNKYTSQDTTSFSVIDHIATEFAGLSYGVYSARTHKKIDNHPLMAIMRRPNLEDTHFNFMYQSIVDYYNGGIYWKKGRGTSGELVSLFRLNPNAVTNMRDSVTRERLYLYNGKRYTDDDIVYIPSRFNYSTIYGGQSIFKAANGAFDTAQKLDNFTNNSFDKAISGKRLIIDISNALPDATKEQVEELRTDYTETYAGPENAGKPLFKKKGIEYSEIGGSQDNRSATLIENRQFQEHEISKLFAFPGELLSGSSANVDMENLFTLLTEFAIKPLAQQLQETINLLIDSDTYYFEFNYYGLLKVSLTKRVDAYTKQIGNGILSPNEVRLKENMPPIEAGDNFFMPANLMPLNDETINAYMAKQKLTAQGLDSNSSEIGPDNSDQHSPAGDDKQ